MYVTVNIEYLLYKKIISETKKVIRLIRICFALEMYILGEEKCQCLKTIQFLSAIRRS